MIQGNVLNPNRNSTILLLWFVVCTAVFVCIDFMATRPVQIHLEEFRASQRTDDDCFIAAVQAAQDKGSHWWWINDAHPVIILDDDVDYQINPVFYERTPVPILKKSDFNKSFVARPIPAITTR